MTIFNTHIIRAINLNETCLCLVQLKDRVEFITMPLDVLGDNKCTTAVCDKVCDEICDKICDSVCDEVCATVCDQICDEVCDRYCYGACSNAA